MRSNLNVMQLVNTYEFKRVSLIGMTTFIPSLRFEVPQVNLHFYCNFGVGSKVVYIEMGKVWELTGCYFFYIIYKWKSAVFKNRYYYCLAVIFYHDTDHKLNKVWFSRHRYNRLNGTCRLIVTQNPVFFKANFQSGSIIIVDVNTDRSVVLFLHDKHYVFHVDNYPKLSNTLRHLFT